jgi:transcriptional regulator with XRE-family HTH domain
VKKKSATTKIKRLSNLIEELCGLYARVARRLGVHRTYVSRVARGERRSEAVENALIAEYDRVRPREADLL